MHPILADGRRLFAYLVAWGLVGVLISAQLLLAAPFAWAGAFAVGLPLTLVFGFAGLGAFWVCQAAPLQLSRMVRSLATQLIASVISAALWLGAARGWAIALERIDLFPGLVAKQAQVAPLMLGLGVASFLLTAALKHLLMACGGSQVAAAPSRA